MNMIEEYWKDVSVYSVEFISQIELGEKRKHSKILAFTGSISREEVYYLVPLYLNNVKEVLYVDELTDGGGLLLKEIRSEYGK